VPEAFPFTTDGICHRIHDGGVDIEFAWLRTDEASLAAAPAYPVPLRPFLARLPPILVHIVDRRDAEARNGGIAP
jgi:hypothetical protein